MILPSFTTIHVDYSVWLVVVGTFMPSDYVVECFRTVCGAGCCRLDLGALASDLLSNPSIGFPSLWFSCPSPWFGLSWLACFFMLPWWSMQWEVQMQGKTTLYRLSCELEYPCATYCGAASSMLIDSEAWVNCSKLCVQIPDYSVWSSIFFPLWSSLLWCHTKLGLFTCFHCDFWGGHFIDFSNLGSRHVNS